MPTRIVEAATSWPRSIAQVYDSLITEHSDWPVVASLQLGRNTMMTRADSPSDVRPGSERRRAVRVRPGPIRVRLHRTCEGILVDISETGALVQVPSSQAPQKDVTLQVEWRDAVLPLRARVIRSNPHRLQLATATLARAEYQVAVEFSDVTPDEAAILKRIVRGE